MQGSEFRHGIEPVLFENLLGVRCNAKKMQRLATRLGTAMEADRRRREPAPPAHGGEAVIHGFSDGTGVPVPNPKRPVVAVARKTAWHTPGKQRL